MHQHPHHFLRKFLTAQPILGYSLRILPRCLLCFLFKSLLSVICFTASLLACRLCSINFSSWRVILRNGICPLKSKITWSNKCSFHSLLAFVSSLLQNNASLTDIPGVNPYSVSWCVFKYVSQVSVTCLHISGFSGKLNLWEPSALLLYISLLHSPKNYVKLGTSVDTLSLLESLQASLTVSSQMLYSESEQLSSDSYASSVSLLTETPNERKTAFSKHGFAINSTVLYYRSHFL